MDLRIVVIDRATTARHELKLSARRGAPGRFLAAHLRDALGREAELFIGAERVDDCRWGQAPLTDGAVITIGHRADREDLAPWLVCVEGRGCGGSWRVPRGTHEVGRDAGTIRLDNELLPPHAGNLVVGPAGVRFLDSTGRLSVPLVPGRSWEMSGSVLTIPQRLPDLPPGVSQGDFTRLAVQLRAQWSGTFAMLVSALLPLAAGILMAWLWHYWLMAVFSVVSAMTSLTIWWARGGGRARNRRLLRAAKIRELAMIDRFCPPLGIRLAHACLASPTAEKITGSGHDASLIPADDALPWIRWGRGERPLHVRATSPGSLSVTGNMPILSHLKFPHVISMAQTGSVDGLEVLKGHLTVAKIPFTWLSCGRGCSVCRAVDERLGPGVPSGRTRQDTLRIACAERSLDPESLPHVILTREDRHHHPSPGWNGVLVSPAGQGIELRVVGDAKEALLGADDDARQLCARPDLPDREALQTLRAMRRPAGYSHHDVPRLSAREELAVEEVPARWARHAKDPRLLIDIGVRPDRDEDIRVDMNAQGPHALLAGTTGSGKSEFLRAVLYRLCLTYSPERVGVVLIDFKGGAGFGPAIHLPHVHSCVTDLDGSATVRALSYLEAEIARREALLNDAEFTSWKDYYFSGEPSEMRPDMPEIVIVVDEFRHLVDTHPCALQRLLRVAAAGRSLGLHLILSTQRPQGAVSQDIRANTSIDICLRVTRDQDSIDILGTPRAARIPTTMPGRGFARFDGVTREFQSVWVDRLPALPPTVPTATRMESEPSSSREESERLLTRETKELAHRSGPRRGGGGPVVPPPLPTPDIALWMSESGRRGEASDREELLLGPAENPGLAWQGRLSWHPRNHSGLALIAAVPVQSRFLAALWADAVSRQMPVYLCVFDRTIHQHVSRWKAKGLEVRALGTPTSLTFVLEVLRELLLHVGEGTGPRPLLIFQGLDRWIDETTRRGLDLVPTVEEVLTGLSRSWFVAVLSNAPLPQRLAGMLPNRLEWADTNPSGPRTSLAAENLQWLNGLCRVEGPITDGRSVVGLSLPPAEALVEFPRGLPAKEARPTRRHDSHDDPWPTFQDVPEELCWSADSSPTNPRHARHAHPRSSRPSIALRGSIAIGISAPWGRDCELPWRRGDVIGAVINGAEMQERFVEVLTLFHDGAELNIYSPTRGVAAPRRHQRPSPIGSPGARLAVITDFAEWDVASHESLKAVTAAHDATVVLVPASALVLPHWWSRAMSEATCAVVIGPGSSRLPFDRRESSLGDPTQRRRDEGVLLAGTSQRFKLPRVGTHETDP